MQYGTGEHHHKLTLHHLYDKQGAALAEVVVKIHILTGDDSMSKFATKLATMKMDHVKYLVNFAEGSIMSDEEVEKAEQYLVNVWAGVK